MRFVWTRTVSAAGLRDSKMLTAARRETLFDEIMAVAEVSVAHASVEQIDRLNILRASHLAMERAVAGLKADHALIDGNLVPRDQAWLGDRHRT